MGWDTLRGACMFVGWTQCMTTLYTNVKCQVWPITITGNFCLFAVIYISK